MAKMMKGLGSALLVAVAVSLSAGAAQAQSAGSSLFDRLGISVQTSRTAQRRIVANVFFQGSSASRIEAILGRPITDILPPNVVVRPIVPRPPVGGGIVSAVPEPAAALLFATGLGIAGLRRSRRDDA
ncbi:MAG: PEP-CTERM sorting domain-containing protein [Spirochaetaceae bacterium]|nr:PEP-CTERM sorting domain-containing protein [Myxococcales bacterium]MCB9725175.1 PEP-CTERM sorting domain-containing protein [Spirochaetaceae bacterium]HPG24709.1 PEP-CTERM sorting domain-containing protein [Myxococcota bacterium]